MIVPTIIMTSILLFHSRAFTYIFAEFPGLSSIMKFFKTALLLASGTLVTACELKTGSTGPEILQDLLRYDERATDLGKALDAFDGSPETFDVVYGASGEQSQAAKRLIGDCSTVGQLCRSDSKAIADELISHFDIDKRFLGTFASKVRSRLMVTIVMGAS